MKANEFVKNCGIDSAKSLLKIGSGYCDIMGYGFHTDDLKRLVKSHDMVNSVGGLDAANRIVCDAFHGSNGDIPEGHEKLSLAIQDVESCHVD